MLLGVFDDFDFYSVIIVIDFYSVIIVIDSVIIVIDVSQKEII